MKRVVKSWGPLAWFATIAAILALLAFNIALHQNPPLSTALLPQTPIATPAVQERANAGWKPALVATPQSLQRPLFSPTRRPFVAKAAVPKIIRQPKPEPAILAATLLAEPPEIALIGVRGTANTLRALVRGAGGEDSWVSAGDAIEEWSVAAVTERAITITSGQQSLTVELFDHAR